MGPIQSKMELHLLDTGGMVYRVLGRTKAHEAVWSCDFGR